MRAELPSGSLAQVADNKPFFNSMSPELPVLLCLLGDTQPHAHRKRNVPQVQARAGVILALGAARRKLNSGAKHTLMESTR